MSIRSFIAIWWGVSIGLFPLHAYSERDEFYIRQAQDRYFSLPRNARSVAMGGALDPLIMNSTSMYSNPAGLGFISRPELALGGELRELSGNEHPTDNLITQEGEEGQIALAIPLGRERDYGTIGLGYSRYAGDTEDVINTRPDGHRRTGAYALEITPDTALGYAFTFFDDQLNTNLSDYHAHLRFRHSFGVQVGGQEGLRFGSSLFFGHGKADYEEFLSRADSQAEVRGRGINLGVGYTLASTYVATSLDFTKYLTHGETESAAPAVVTGDDEKGERLTLAVGIEQRIFNPVLLRAGYHYFVTDSYEFKRPGLEAISGEIHAHGWTAGLGLQFSSFLFDYAAEYRDIGRGDWSHLITISLPFKPW